MKKLLALVLSLIMIMTSVFIVPFSAQAEQYPILPIPGTISTQCLTNESKYVSGNEKGRINYTYNVPSAGTLRLNINATLAGYDKDVMCSIWLAMFLPTMVASSSGFLTSKMLI